MGGGLKFLFEEPNEGVIQFLDLSLSFKEKQVCWSFRPRSRKAILDYRSAHSKIVKRGIAVSCLGTTLRKSCEHSMGDSFMG